MNYISLTKGIKYTGYSIIEEMVVVYFEDGADDSLGNTMNFENQDEFYKTPEIMQEIAHALGGEYCWAKCYNENGEEVLIEAITDDYDTFYYWLDNCYGYDVIDDGDE